MALTDEQLERYSRHIILKEVGAKGQKKLLEAKVLIIGAGGLGAPAAMYLAAAGVGTIGIADADEVDLSNLQRQIIHGTKDVGKAKVKSAQETIAYMNPDVKVNTYRTFVSSENVRELIRDYDFIIDGTDNFPAKFLIQILQERLIITVQEIQRLFYTLPVLLLADISLTWCKALFDMVIQAGTFQADIPRQSSVTSF